VKEMEAIVQKAAAELRPNVRRVNYTTPHFIIFLIVEECKVILGLKSLNLFATMEISLHIFITKNQHFLGYARNSQKLYLNCVSVSRYQ
jgi:hypothetical protein